MRNKIEQTTPHHCDRIEAIHFSFTQSHPRHCERSEAIQP